MTLGEEKSTSGSEVALDRTPKLSNAGLVTSPGEEKSKNVLPENDLPESTVAGKDVTNPDA